MYEINVFKACESGPRVCLVGGVHGNEGCGIYALNVLKGYLQNILRGQVSLLIANPEAVQSNQRFIDFDLNRCFGNSCSHGYEHILAEEIKSYFYSSAIEYVLDLHSTSSNSMPFCAGVKTRKHLDVFRATQLDVYMHGWERHRGHNMLIDEVNRLGGTGVIVECGKHDQQKTNEMALWVAANFLRSLRLISDETLTQIFDNSSSFRSYAELGYSRKKVIEIREIVRVKTPNFYFTKQYRNLEHIVANEIVAYDGATAVQSTHEFFMAMPTAGALHLGDEAFGIGIEDVSLVT